MNFLVFSGGSCCYSLKMGVEDVRPFPGGNFDPTSIPRHKGCPGTKHVTRREEVVSYLFWEGQRLGEEGQNSHRGIGALGSLSALSRTFPKACHLPGSP